MEETGLGGVGVCRLRERGLGGVGVWSVEVEGEGAGGSRSMEVKEVDDECGLPSTSEEAGTVRKRQTFSDRCHG